MDNSTEQTTNYHSINTDVDGSDITDIINITENALNEIIRIKNDNNIPNEYKLRIGTRSGGCHGLNYIIGFDPDVYENDRVFCINNQDIVIDNKSIFYLMGISLDFKDTPESKGFFFNNPNNVNTCGCHS